MLVHYTAAHGRGFVSTADAAVLRRGCAASAGAPALAASENRGGLMLRAALLALLTCSHAARVGAPPRPLGSRLKPVRVQIWPTSSPAAEEASHGGSGESSSDSSNAHAAGSWEHVRAPIPTDWALPPAYSYTWQAEQKVADSEAAAEQAAATAAAIAAQAQQQQQQAAAAAAAQAAQAAAASAAAAQEAAAMQVQLASQNAAQQAQQAQQQAQLAAQTQAPPAPGAS